MMKYLLPLVLVFMLLSCGDNRHPETRRSVYYWSTVLDMDSAKTAFIRSHDIGRMYLRYFDVVKNESGEIMPNATLAFNTGVPDGVEIIPTVYITNACMRGDVDGLAEKIYRRIMQMSEAHDVGPITEIQMDCDWTLTTRQSYFHFLEKLGCLAHDKQQKVSATIRLHQLSQPVPPVDKGVLMMYNTGDFTDIKCEKPILDMRVVTSYISRLGDYELPLSTAYPLFGWRILFRGERYVGILHSDDELPVLPSDSIVVRQPGINDILAAVKAVENERHDANDEVILYDLSNRNIQIFSPDDYEKIYNH